MLLAVNINLVAFSSFPGRSGGQVFTSVRADRRRRRGRDWPCDSGLLLPQPRHDRGRRCQRDEGLSHMETIILFAPLVGALLVALAGASSVNSRACGSTTGLSVSAAAPVLGRFPDLDGVTRKIRSCA